MLGLANQDLVGVISQGAGDDFDDVADRAHFAGSAATGTAFGVR
jgi:hypothetical protein